MYRLFVDIEATGNGTNPFHDIVELDAKLYDNESYISNFSAKYAPSESTAYQDKENGKGRIGAVEMEANRRQKYEDSTVGFIKFFDWLNKLRGNHKVLLVAFNCNWDEKHLKNWFLRNSKNYSNIFYNPCICTMSLCSLVDGNEPFPNLKSCAKSLGFEVDTRKFHTAEYDNQLNLEIYEELKGRAQT